MTRTGERMIAQDCPKLSVRAVAWGMMSHQQQATSIHATQKRCQNTTKIRREQKDASHLAALRLIPCQKGACIIIFSKANQKKRLIHSKQMRKSHPAATHQRIKVANLLAESWWGKKSTNQLRKRQLKEQSKKLYLQQQCSLMMSMTHQAFYKQVKEDDHDLATMGQQEATASWAQTLKSLSRKLKRTKIPTLSITSQMATL